jgi:flagellar biogenesis protein FliO
MKDILPAAIQLAPAPLPPMPAPAAAKTVKPSPQKIEAAGLLPVNTAAAPTPANAPTPAGADSSRGSSWFAVVLVVLVGVAGGVLAFTRRRSRREGLIQILETAAIGPKRSLLVARVNGQTMILGASEAGIALLGSLEGKIDAPVGAIMGNLPSLRDRYAEPETAAKADAESAEPDGEMGVLRRLFRLRPKPTPTRDDAAFRELLEESYEDQTLRDRLSQGLTAKVS